MQYHLVEAQSAEDLERLVQEKINEGWEPQGGVAVATYGVGSWWYYQAMIFRPSQSY
jgi:hypothetical protein